MMRRVSHLLMVGLGLILVVLAGVFAASNDNLATLGLWPWQARFSVPVWLIGLGGFGLGVIFGGVVMGLPLIASKWQQTRLRRRMTLLEKNHRQTDDSPAKPRLPRL